MTSTASPRPVTLALVLLLPALLAACVDRDPPSPPPASTAASPTGAAPDDAEESAWNPAVGVIGAALSSISCTRSTDTGYVRGSAFTITVVHVDGKPVEVATANAYYVMAQAAAASGVNLAIVSGFRTYAQQQYLYGCYINCNCNGCNLAARPGYSNHQSGHALDLNTSAPGVLNWLNAHGAAYGFRRTVPGEAWHWEWWGGGPGGGPCQACQPRCDGSVIVGSDCGRGDCAAFGATCLHPPGQAPHCGQACTPRCDGAVMVGADCGRGDCGAFGAGCAMQGGAPTCVTCRSHCEGSVVVGTDCGRGDCGAFGAACIQPPGEAARCGQPCTPRCEGSVGVGADCSRGDCAVFGGTCAMQGGAPTCAFPCTPHCEGDVVVDAACGRGDCAAFGATCHLVDSGGALRPECTPGCTPHCEGAVVVDASCGRGDCGAFGVTCRNDGEGPVCGAAPPCTHRCDGAEVVYSDCSRGSCGAFGLTCVDFGLGPQCALAACTPQCDGSVIVDAGCQRGDCGVFGLACSTAGGSAPHCVSPLCVAAGEVPVAHDICSGGKVWRCGPEGVPTELTPQPPELCNGLDDDCDGETDEGVRNACGTCGAAPEEVCNGLDDDCDGETDEGMLNACGVCGLAPAEQCNGLDDDCDGETDEGFGLGESCVVGVGTCAVPGVVVCAPDALETACAALTAPCDDGDPCTVDDCKGSGCEHQRVAACCADGSACGDGLVCRAGACVAALCASCERDEDCPAGGACLGYAFGTGCGTACEPEDGAGACPEGFSCVSGLGRSVCVAEAERCACGEGEGARRCVGRDVVRVDGCGTPVAVLETCPVRCARGACEGGEPDGSPSADADASPGDADPGVDAAAGPDATPAGEDTTAVTPSSRSRAEGCGGCGGGHDPSAPLLVVIASLLWLGSMRRRRERSPNGP